jgi:hypothetical protein
MLIALYWLSVSISEYLDPRSESHGSELGDSHDKEKRHPTNRTLKRLSAEEHGTQRLQSRYRRGPADL